MMIAHLVKALVGPIPGSLALLLMNSPTGTLALMLSVRLQSRLATESVMLTQAEETIFRRMLMFCSQNCWLSFQLWVASTGKMSFRSTAMLRGASPSSAKRKPSRIRPELRSGANLPGSWGSLC